MDQTDPQVMAMLQALQGAGGTAGMMPQGGMTNPQVPPQQASMGNQPMQQQNPMYGAMMTPPPMTPPPPAIY